MHAHTQQRQKITHSMNVISPSTKQLNASENCNNLYKMIASYEVRLLLWPWRYGGVGFFGTGFHVICYPKSSSGDSFAELGAKNMMGNEVRYEL